MIQDIYLLCLSTLISILVTYAFKYVSPSASVVHWFPHYFEFKIPASPASNNIPLSLKTYTIVVQNIGSRLAEHIEIVFQKSPMVYHLFPSLDHTFGNTPAGEYIIRIEHLARNEFVTIECLDFQYPTLSYIRSKNGLSQVIQTAPQKVRGNFFILINLVFLFLGVTTFSYWLFRAIIFLLKHI
jgi:hypothetical protein